MSYSKPISSSYIGSCRFLLTGQVDLVEADVAATWYLLNDVRTAWIGVECSPAFGFGLWLERGYGDWWTHHRARLDRGRRRGTMIRCRRARVVQKDQGAWFREDCTVELKENGRFGWSRSWKKKVAVLDVEHEYSALALVRLPATAPATGAVVILARRQSHTFHEQLQLAF